MPKKSGSKVFRPPKRVRAPRLNRSRRQTPLQSSAGAALSDSSSGIIVVSNDSWSSTDGELSAIPTDDSDVGSDARTPNTSEFGSVEDLFASIGDDTIDSLSTCDVDTSETESGRESSTPTPLPPPMRTPEPTPAVPAPSPKPTSAVPTPAPEPTSAVPTLEPTPVATHSLSNQKCNELLTEINSKLCIFLPSCWISMVEGESINVMLLSRKAEKAIQRRINCDANGNLLLSVHGTPTEINEITKDFTHPGVLHKENVNSYVDYIVSVMNEVRRFEICSGADSQEYKEAWQSIPNSYIDCNFFQECRYASTLRVNKCKLLVEPRVRRCKECNKVNDRLRKKIVSVKKEEANPSTANIHLTKKQSLKKMKTQQNKIAAGKKTIERLQKKMQLLIKEEGMNVDEELFEKMQEAVEGQNLSPSQSLFLQQQLKAASCRNSKGMRWHPSMIQFALSLFLASPSFYNIMLTSGMMKLPSTRTLFDYSHVYEAKEGISMPVLQKISERLAQKPELKFKWHTIMCDEMHISQNIVYHKASGTIVGYVKLLEVEKAVNDLQAYLDSTEKTERETASKVLSFMVKGVANDVKEVIASFSIKKLSKLNLYSMTWKVIVECERSGIQIIVMTSDGNAVNRAFFKMNTPITPTKSGIVFDTVNKACPSRPLYFMSDVPHLIKTIRNNFFNSRPFKNSKRCLTKNGQKILWSTIIRLFNEKKDMPLRKSYKLNKANVYPDSYSCMKVQYAFQVLSKTVATDIEAQGWPGTEETVKFILKVNDVADCLNGAHSSSGIKSGNKLLNPYTSSDDTRFSEVLLPFLEYLEEWREEALQADASIINRSVQNPDDPNDSFHSLHDVHETAAESMDHPARKRMLCQQTLDGIEITIRGFIGAVKYLLDHGGLTFINARVFCQDPLEQFFSKQRQKGGGSNTPNLQRYMENARAIHVQRGLSVRKRSANTRADDAFEISNEKMPRRTPNSRLD